MAESAGGRGGTRLAGGHESNAAASAQWRWPQLLQGRQPGKQEGFLLLADCALAGYEQHLAS